MAMLMLIMKYAGLYVLYFINEITDYAFYI